MIRWNTLVDLLTASGEISFGIIIGKTEVKLAVSTLASKYIGSGTRVYILGCDADYRKTSLLLSGDYIDIKTQDSALPDLCKQLSVFNLGQGVHAGEVLNLLSDRVSPGDVVIVDEAWQLIKGNGEQYESLFTKWKEAGVHCFIATGAYDDLNLIPGGQVIRSLATAVFGTPKIESYSKVLEEQALHWWPLRLTVKGWSKMRNKKLSPGVYVAKVPHSNPMRAAVDGLFPVFPEAEMHYDGDWCRFFKDGKEVYSCNPVFASANFELTGPVKTLPSRTD